MSATGPAPVRNLSETRPGPDIYRTFNRTQRGAKVRNRTCLECSVAGRHRKDQRDTSGRDKPGRKTSPAPAYSKGRKSGYPDDGAPRGGEVIRDDQQPQNF